MQNLITSLKRRLKEFIPMSFLCLREGYGIKNFYKDLFAGACVGVIAIPLSLAFAISSGVAPERGLYTAIVAGFLISCLGGSRLQIGGPTGAFVVLVYSIISKFGYEGLALATLIASFLLILMSVARFGAFLKFIPQHVIVGFTTGIALVIFSSQIKDFLGLNITALPPEFLDKCVIYFKTIHTWNPWAVAIALPSLILTFLLRHYFPRLPGAMIAISLATLVTYFFHLPLETIGSKFGEIRHALPPPHLPFFSLELFIKVFPSAIAVAFLGGLEALLCASIADRLAGTRHHSNCELAAQGIANLGSILFGGIPATGAIARTSANVKMGASTPVSGMIHAITLFLLIFCFSPLVGKIPLAALAGVLVFVSWNMAELPHFLETLKGQKGDALALVATFVLTLLIDIIVAVQVGVVLSAIVFLKRMTDRTVLDKREESIPTLQETSQVHQKILPEIAVFELNGPFFYTVSHLLDDALVQLKNQPKAFVLCLDKTLLVDATGQRALRQFSLKCKQKNIAFLIAGAKKELLHKSTIEQHVGKEHIFSNIDAALSKATSLL